MVKENTELDLAREFIRHTSCNIFLTGKAGTGKTTFLHEIARQGEKRLIITAPTGVAAINAGGVTLHSFFQMPFGPFVPGSDTYAEQKHHRMSREKKNIIQSLDLLIIDEISMVRADLLDCVDHMLRRHRHSDKPFAGVQLLMIGDLHQLPPVVKEHDWQLLKDYYESPYFFSSNALRQTEFFPIELKHIYRQSDQAFIDILNKVRNNQLDKETVERLNSRLIPDFTPSDNEGYITLCTHNNRAAAINRLKLDELQGRPFQFHAELDGEFPEQAYPTIDTLELKEGAQVMFVRNDPSPDKEYFNGKIGTVASIGNEVIQVKCPEDSFPISVPRATWENTRYTLDSETGEISSEVIGTFTQYPLKLAWAITIHKSQGLTFDRAIIDAEAAFAHGQVYVALSRCRSFDGLVLRTPLSWHGVRSDQAVSRFTAYTEQNPPTPAQLQKAKIQYQQGLLLDAFSFEKLRGALNNLVILINRNAGIIHMSGVTDLDKIYQQTLDEIVTVGENFKRQLVGFFQQTVLPGDDPAVLERLAKAMVYFQEKLSSLPLRVVAELETETDNKEIRKRIKKAQKWLQEETAIKLAAVQSCGDSFSPPKYLRAISNAEIELSKPVSLTSSTVNYSESDIAHPELFRQLKEWRSAKAQTERLAPFHIMHQKTLIQIAVHMPDNLDAFKKVKGIGKKLAEKYGEELVSLVSAYKQENRITEVVLPAKESATEKGKDQPADVPKGQTRQHTLELFQKGFSIEQIAEQRELTQQTIEGHLAHWVKQGKINLEGLVDQGKVEKISMTMENNPDATFKQLKDMLGQDCSYGDLKLVKAFLSASDNSS